MRAILCVALLFAAPAPQALAAASAAPVQDREELDQILDDRLVASEDIPVDQIWAEAKVVATLIGDEYGEAFDQALDQRLAKPASGRAVLFLVAARLLGEDPDMQLLSEALLPLLEADEDKLAIAATDLFATAGFEREDIEMREAVANTLLEVCEDGQRSPRLRTQAALAAYQVGLGGQTPRSRAVLYGFLGSSDPNLRARGALAMAQLGIIEEVAGVEEELADLASLPGPDGRLAAAYIKQVRLRRFHDRQLENAFAEQRRNISSSALGADLERMERLIDFVQSYHLEGSLVSREELLQAAMNGMLQSLDRHSTYFDPKSYKRFEQDLEAEYGGIGAYVGIDREDGLFTITRPIYSGPAYLAGLTTDDKIVRIGDWPTIGEVDTEVIKRLKGRPNTEVELFVWRRGMDPELIERPTDEMRVVVNRAAITIPPVHHEMLPGKVGLVELTTFSRVASSEMQRALVALLEDGAEAIVLDLRNNTGGLLQEARNVADLFLDKGKLVVSTERRGQRPTEYRTRSNGQIPPDMPVAVLINRFSASAAEIVAGALQDHRRGVLVGQRSYGKGSVQNLFRMPEEADDGFEDENGNRRHDNWETLTNDQNQNGEFDYAPRIKLTVERYLLPTGRSIHRELDEEGNVTSPGGVSPDVLAGTRRYDSWRLVAMRKVQDTRKLRSYAKKLHADQPELAQQLAAGDGDDWSKYPGFEDLYAELETVLSRADVRFLLRMDVRRAVQDSRGSAFPLGDYQEDLQLQKAIAQLLEEMGKELSDVQAFARTFDDNVDAADTPPVAIARADELSAAIDLVSDADDGKGELTSERLSALRELLEALAR